MPVAIHDYKGIKIVIPDPDTSAEESEDVYEGI